MPKPKHQGLKLSCIQVSNLIEVLERFGVALNIESDAHYSEMLVELIVSALRELDSDQVKELWDAI